MRAIIYLCQIIGALLLWTVCGEGSAAPAQQAQFNTHFVAIAFHDIVDAGQPADFDGVSADKLVAFMDWLKADGWTPVSAADVTEAAMGHRSLPPKAIVLGFDDGYVSFYNRVYPLLLAYRYPAVLSLVGEWMSQAPGTMVDYGGRPVPREHFLTWDQVRRMQASGLVEVASHTFDLHRTVLINRQGNSVGAPRAWVFDPKRNAIETDQQHRARIYADLVKSRDLIARETGIVPHVLVWPYGRFSGPGVEVARSLGFDQIYSLTPDEADARNPLQIPRYYPTRDPDLGEIVENLRFDPQEPRTVRAACVDLSALAAAHGSAARDAILGRMIEDLRRLGPNMIIIDALRYGAHGSPPIASWVSTSLLPVEADILSRAARQLGLRGGVDVYVRLHLPELVKAIGERGTVDLARQVTRVAPITGLALDGEGGTALPGPVLNPSGVRSIRAAANSGSPLMFRVMRGAMEIDPELRLMVIAKPGEQSGPPDGADTILLQPVSGLHDAAEEAARFKARGWFDPGVSGRILLGIPQSEPKIQAQSIREMQEEGANAFALCPWVEKDSSVLAPVFSAAAFPYRP